MSDVVTIIPNAITKYLVASEMPLLPRGIYSKTYPTTFHSRYYSLAHSHLSTRLRPTKLTLVPIHTLPICKTLSIPQLLNNDACFHSWLTLLFRREQIQKGFPSCCFSFAEYTDPGCCTRAACCSRSCGTVFTA